MKAHRKVVAFSIVPLLMVFVCGVSAEQPSKLTVVDRNDTLQQILLAWEERRVGIRQVEYSISGTKVVPKRSLIPTADFPSVDCFSKFETKWCIDFRKSLVRKDNTKTVASPHMRAWHPHKALTIYDGVSVVDFILRSGKKPLVKRSADPRTAARIFMIFDRPLFLVHGVQWVGPRVIENLNAHTAETQAFYIYRHTREDDSETVILRCNYRDDGHNLLYEYEVDPYRQGAVLAIRVYRHYMIRHQFDITYVEIDGWWVPRAWRHSVSRSDGTFLGAHEVAATNIVVNPNFTSELFHAQ